MWDSCKFMNLHGIITALSPLCVLTIVIHNGINATNHTATAVPIRTEPPAIHSATSSLVIWALEEPSCRHLRLRSFSVNPESIGQALYIGRRWSLSTCSYQTSGARGVFDQKSDDDLGGGGDMIERIGDVLRSRNSRFFSSSLPPCSLMSDVYPDILIMIHPFNLIPNTQMTRALVMETKNAKV